MEKRKILLAFAHDHSHAVETTRVTLLLMRDFPDSIEDKDRLKRAIEKLDKINQVFDKFYSEFLTPTKDI